MTPRSTTSRRDPAPPGAKATCVIAWETARGCNLACVHCRAKRGTSRNSPPGASDDCPPGLERFFYA
jgi:MoaA/NifB/PqqE/SkfB family radical SAM enzyme